MRTVSLLPTIQLALFIVCLESLYICKETLPDPPKLSKDVRKEVIVTSLHWTSTEQHGPLLLVTYMHHGV